jgi:hypothetical protein
LRRPVDLLLDVVVVPRQGFPGQLPEPGLQLGCGEELAPGFPGCFYLGTQILGSLTSLPGRLPERCERLDFPF